MLSRRLLLTLTVIFGTVGVVAACSVPVFRYALERWLLSPYEVLVYHRGPLTADQKKELDQLEELRQTCNLDITTIDLNKRPEPHLKELWQKHGKEEQLPRVVVRYPGSKETTPLLFSGSLSEAHTTRLFDSPFRREVVQNLGSGETAVVLVLQGKNGNDPKLIEMLQREIARLQNEIRLPDQTSDGPQIESKIPVRVSFLLRHLDRNQPEEKHTVSMLLQTENLHEVEGPIVFLIFGRGRVLCGLHGEQLTADEFEHALKFLCGKCSCQVKELNPGMDLLLTADWTSLLNPVASPVSPIPESKITPTPEQKTPLNASGTTESQSGPVQEQSIVRSSRKTNLVIALGISVGLMILSGFWLWRRPGNVRQ